MLSPLLLLISSLVTATFTLPTLPNRPDIPASSVAGTVLTSLNSTALEPRSIDSNTSYCWTTGRGCCITSYNILIGVPYAEASGCDNVYSELSTNLGVVVGWKCKDDGQGNTQLFFNILAMEASNVNTDLQAMYPMVASFDCTDFRSSHPGLPRKT